MSRFRKRPVVIEAVQWTGERAAGDGVPPAWYSNSLLDGLIRRDKDRKLKLWTDAGVMTASPGDWIVKGIRGELYPVNAEIFNDTYELA